MGGPRVTQCDITIYIPTSGPWAAHGPYQRCYLSVTIVSLLDNTEKSSGIHYELCVQQTVVITGLLEFGYRCGI